MKDLNNAPRASKIIEDIQRYQQLEKIDHGMWTSVEVTPAKSEKLFNNQVVICAGNMSKEEMSAFQNEMMFAVKSRIKALNEELESL